MVAAGSIMDWPDTLYIPKELNAGIPKIKKLFRKGYYWMMGTFRRNLKMMRREIMKKM